MNGRQQVLNPFRQNEQVIHARVKAGIERFRKGDFLLRVTDCSGAAIPNAEIRVRQIRHDFLHGCNLFLLDEIEDAQKNERCKELFAGAFNQATLPFYWKDLEPKKGLPRYRADAPRIYRRPAPDLCLAWCEANDVTPKAHCLNYYNEMPAWIPTEREAFWTATEEHFSQLAARYAARIPSWEVTNETLRFRTGNTFSDDTIPFYEPDFVEHSFTLAERYFPQNERIINEAHFNIWGDCFKDNRSAYYMQIERALEKSAAIDTIGMQFHMFFPQQTELADTAPYYDPERLFAVLDRYSDFGKPLQITEVTIPAYSESPEDEQIQAELLRYLYSIWFSHPQMEAITYWNLIDGYAWSEDQIPGNMHSGENVYYGGLLRFDGTPKPAYRTLRELFDREWHTELETRTDEAGCARVRGFFGTYELTVRAGGRSTTCTVCLTRGAENCTIQSK